MSKARQLADNGASTPNRNILINGATNISQRGTSFTGLGSSNAVTFGADRFYLYTANTAGRVTMEPLTADGPSGFANSVKLSCTTADTSIAANELILFSQAIEGRNLQRTDKGSSTAKKLTASFYVKGNAAATYMFILYDTDNNRISTTQFGVTTSWNRIEVAIPADTTGAFNDDNNLSAYFQFYLHAGSNYTSGTYTAGTWQTNTNANFAPGISSFVDATSRTLFITGCQLEVSDAATPFEHKTFSQDLQESLRYYYQTNLYPDGSGDVSGMQFLAISTGEAFASGRTLPQKMRAAPTITIVNLDGGSGGATILGGSHLTGVAANYIYDDNWTRLTKTSGWSAGNFLSCDFKADAELS